MVEVRGVGRRLAVDVEYVVDGDELVLDLVDPRADRKRAWRQLRSLGAPLELEPTAATVKARVPKEALGDVERVLGMMNGTLVPASGEPALDAVGEDTPAYEEIRPLDPEDTVDAARDETNPEPFLKRAIADLGTFAQESPQFAHRVERDKRYLRRALEALTPKEEPEEEPPDPVKQEVSRLLRGVPDEDTWRAREFLLDLHGIADRFGDEAPHREIPQAIPGFQGELRGYQREGVSFLIGTNLNAILADGMGTGKTVQTIAATLLAGVRALVVCPANVLHNWAAEVERFTGEQAAIWHGRDVDGNDEARFRITTYASLRYRDWRDTDATTRPLLVLDEAHNIRNPETQRARLVKDLPQQHRILLTGTPIVNGLEDYNELLLNVGEDRWPDAATFRETWMSDRQMLTKHPEVRQATADLLQRATQHVVLRRRKHDVLDDLPPRTITIERHPLTGEQRTAYDAQQDHARKIIQNAQSKVQVFAQIHKLRQILLEHRTPFIVERIQELLGAGERLVVYAHYLDALDEIQNAFPDVSARIDGSTPPRERERISQDLGEPDGPRVLIAQTEAGGVGLNFTGARWVLFAHLGWTAAVHKQAIDRVHRIGQDEPVHVTFFLTPDTIDERMADLILEKEADANLALADKDTIMDRTQLAQALLDEAPHDDPA